jgi:hypothetical protein
MVHGIRELQGRRGKSRDIRLWPWSRMTGWRAVHAVMAAAGLKGVPASPKGLRHGFGVAAVTAGIPLNLVQKWLGHAQLSTTAVYANAVGAEEERHRATHVGLSYGPTGGTRAVVTAGKAVGSNDDLHPFCDRNNPRADAAARIREYEYLIDDRHRAAACWPIPLGKWFRRVATSRPAAVPSS